MTHRLVALALVLLIADGAAQAWQGTGSHIRRSTDAPIDASAPGAARIAANLFSRCFAREHPDYASAVLELPFQSEEQRRFAEQGFAEIGDVSCMQAAGLGGDTRTAGGNPVDVFEINPVLRNLFIDDFSLVGAFAEERLAAADFRETEAIGALGDEQIEHLGLTPRNAFERVGLCVARSAPAEVARLAASAVESDEEAAALQAVVPHVGPCVVAGQTVNFNRTSLRSIVVAGLDRAVSRLADQSPSAESPNVEATE